MDESGLYRTLALTLFRDLGDLLGEGRSYVNIATASIRILPWVGIQGNKKKALAGWRLGHALLMCVEPSEAETAWRKIETFKQAEGDLAFGRLQRASEVYLRWFSFQRYWLNGDLLRFGLRDDNLDSFTRPLQEWHAAMDSATLLHQAVPRAISASDTGKQREARAATQEALGLAREQDDRYVAALLLGVLGSLYGAADMWEESASCSRQAQEYFHALEDRRDEMTAFLNLGIEQLRLLLPGEALESIRKGWYLASLLDDERAPAIALRTMGSAYLQIGDASYAKRTLEDALKFMQKAGSHDEEARILNCLGLVCLDLGYASKAIAYLEQAVHLARQLEDQKAEQRYLCLLATAQGVAGKFHVARQSFTKLQTMLLSQGEQEFVGQVHMSIALTYLFQQSLPHYLAHLRRALDFIKENEPTHKRVQQILNQFSLSINGGSTAYEHAWSVSAPLYAALRVAKMEQDRIANG